MEEGGEEPDEGDNFDLATQILENTPGLPFSCREISILPNIYSEVLKIVVDKCFADSLT